MNPQLLYRQPAIHLLDRIFSALAIHLGAVGSQNQITDYEAEVSPRVMSKSYVPNRKPACWKNRRTFSR
jgi:hypothetical protein